MNERLHVPHSPVRVTAATRTAQQPQQFVPQHNWQKQISFLAFNIKVTKLYQDVSHLPKFKEPILHYL